MKTMHRLKTLLAIAGAVALTFSAQAAIKKVKVGKVTWTLSVSGSSAQIGNGTDCAISPQPNGALKIPAKIGKYSIKGISPNAFAECQSMSSVTIPKGVTRITMSAFGGCGSLRKVTLPSTLKSIGQGAFANCIVLSSITIPSGVTSIGAEAFAGCKALPSVTIPKGVQTVGDYAFFNCESLTKAVLADGVTDIGEGAFRNCVLLENLTLPTTLQNIRENAFYSCKALKKVRLAATLEDIGAGAFYDTALEAYDYLKDGLDSTIDSCLKNGSLSNIEVVNLDKRLLLKLTLKTNNKKYGTVSGGGWFEAGTNVTIKAKAKKGYVFNSWYVDKKCTKAVNEDPSIVFVPNNASPTFTMPRVNKTLYAKFVTKAADKKALKFTPATKKLAKNATIGAVNQDFGNLDLYNYSLSATTYSATGLPKGLTISKGGRISGTPTTPGKYSATVTAKSAGGYKISQKVLIYIAAPEYVKGTYHGYAKMTAKASDPLAEVKLSVDKWGGVTAKFAWKGKTYSANTKCSSADDDIAYIPLTVKVGKTSYKFGQVMLTNGYYGDFPMITMMGGAGATSLFARKPLGLITTKTFTDGEGHEYQSAFAGLVGANVNLTEENDESGLANGKTSLNILFKENDVVVVTGKINGKKISSHTNTMIVKRISGSREVTFDFSTGIIDWSSKNYRELRVSLTIELGTFQPDKTVIKLLKPDNLPTSNID